MVSISILKTRDCKKTTVLGILKCELSTAGILNLRIVASIRYNQ